MFSPDLLPRAARGAPPPQPQQSLPSAHPVRLVEEVVTERLRVRVTVADTERVRDTEVVRERDTVGEVE